MNRKFIPWYVYVCELGILGRLPLSPGTWGSLGATLAYWGLCSLGVPVEVLGILTMVLIPGVVPLCTWTSLHMERGDPSNIVVDELIGQWIALFPIFWLQYWTGNLVWGILIGFVLFRFFDVLTVFPANLLERLKGGWGIVLDDCMAGLFANTSVVILGLYLKV